MENPQETFDNKIDLAWLGGIIDADGYVGIVAHRPKRQGYTGYKPRITIANSDYWMIGEIDIILANHGLPRLIRDRYPHRGPKEKHFWEVHIAGVKRVRRVLTQLLPYIRAKKDQAYLTLEFCERRLSVPHTYGYHIGDQWYYEIVRSLKRKGSSETIRAEDIGPKIWSDLLAKAGEVDRNDLPAFIKEGLK